jgi:hypothetical protein
VSPSCHRPFDAFSWFLVPQKKFVEEMLAISTENGGNYQQENNRDQTRKKIAEALNRWNTVS